MRLQLKRVLAVAGVVALVSAADLAHADGSLEVRGIYYKERATRVVPPMLDATLDVGENGVADAHLLTDAITSASIAAGTMLDEKRYEAGGGYRHQVGVVQLGGQARYSTEPDYRSVYAGLRVGAELADRNFTITAAGGLGLDELDNAGEGPTAPRRTGELATYLGSLSLSQILSPNAIATLTYDVLHLDGFQANIYRRVIAGGEVRPELHPEQRTRHALAGTLKWFLPRTATTAIGTYRFYRDDWGIQAHTPELRLLQDVGSSDVVFGASYRFHVQTAADFYQSIYPMSTNIYVTDDPKLSSFRSHTVGMRFEVAAAALGFEGRLGDLRGELLIEYFAQDNRFGNAGIVHAALTYPLEL